MEAFMRRPVVILFALALGIGMTAPRTGLAKAKKAAGGKAAAPSTAELEKLKAIRLGDPKAGVFTWGMSTTDVIEKSKEAIRVRYRKPIEDSRDDQGKQARIEQEREKEIKSLQDSLTKFEGQKTGWDVSIIGPEFAQNNGEAVLRIKEEILTRYFFFFEDRLWKMFLAFNKDVIGAKSFRDFGKEMAAKYGTPREVYRDEKQKGGVKRVLDHFEWAVTGADSLKLVDRSQFYDVYCLVLTDATVIDRVVSKRKMTNPETDQKDSLVEAVVNSKDSSNDVNDDIIDRVTGKETKKPGSEDKHGDIIVPIPAAPSPGDVNGAGNGKKGKKADKVAKEPREKKAANNGLEL
jgi:hypothetical protein